MWSLQHIEMYRESRELTHALLQCMSGLAADGIPMLRLANRSGRGVGAFLAASSDAHRLWSEAITSPFRLQGVERTAFEVSRRPLELVFPQHDRPLETLNNLMVSFVLGAQRAADADPRLCALFYGLSLSEARAIRSLSAASLIQMASRIRVRIDEPQTRCLQQALPPPARSLGQAQAQQLALSIVGVGCGPAMPRGANGTASRAAADGTHPSNPANARKVRVRSDEIRRCLESDEDAAHVGALAHLHEKGLKRPALHSLRGITKAALMLSGVGVKTPQGDSRLKIGESASAMKALEWKRRVFAQHALLLIQIYRKLDPCAQQEIGVDPWAFGVASDLLGSISRKHPMNMYHEDQVLRAFNAGMVDTATCPVHQLEYLVTADDVDISINSACPRCELAHGEGAAHDAHAWHGTEADRAA
ncbi:hypothetical protein [Metallibacterium sp.]|uniref:hypothetical protein n=1 Tax=Metallibacterium sp. TaxID=2940281 RepID=UPI00261E1699|nr:hypothetical protein [Metallibacterium sp.]